jgi:DNA-binding GntR family transcriptional regulator
MLNPGPLPVDQKLLSRKVADWLASRIVSGELTPGERLHETRIAAEAEVSRSPVREALRLLAREGLVELVPRVGAHVASMSPADARSLYAARLLIEPPCAADAVRAMTQAEAGEFDEIHRHMRSCAERHDPQGFLEANVAYNARLIALCDNPVLRELVELTRNKALRYWSVLIRQPSYVSQSIASNTRLNDAVQALDPAAAEVAAAGVLQGALKEIVETFDHVHGRPHHGSREAGAA